MALNALIEARLREAFQPERLRVIDVSHQHAGHSGARPGGETHFEVEIVAERFKGLSRLQRHRMVNEVLADLLRTRIHALAIEANSSD